MDFCSPPAYPVRMKSAGKFRFPGGGRVHRLGPAWKARFGERVQKITLRGGFGCPNRDGRVGNEGCIFCSEHSLVPACETAFGPIEAQLESGMVIAAKHTGARKFIAYFQDQTATDAPLAKLATLYGQAIQHPDVVALAVGTRPDWLPDPVLALLADLQKSKPVMIELGLQSANDAILKRLQRGHTVADFVDAVRRCQQKHIEVIAHVILDLPTETQHDRRQTAKLLNQLAIDGVKIHNLHVMENTILADLYRQGKVQLSSLPIYAQMTADFIQHLRPETIIHRFTGEGPAPLMLAPDWAGDKRRIRNEIDKALAQANAYQGDCLRPKDPNLPTR